MLLFTAYPYTPIKSSFEDAGSVEEKRHSSYVDENGNLHVKNLSAFWIPELTTTEKVGHTTYTVTGSYEGKESFLKKLERIVAKNAQQKFEDEGADE